MGDTRCEIVLYKNIEIITVYVIPQKCQFQLGKQNCCGNFWAAKNLQTFIQFTQKHEISVTNAQSFFECQKIECYNVTFALKLIETSRCE